MSARSAICLYSAPLHFIVCLAMLCACRASASHDGLGPWSVSPVSSGAASSVRVAQAKPTPQSGHNVLMTVTAWRGKRTKLKDWSGYTQFSGPVGRYEARVESGVLTWKHGKSLSGVRVLTDVRGQNGVRLDRWLPAGTTRVVVVIEEKGYGQNPNGGQGGTTTRSPPGNTGSTDARAPSTKTREAAGHDVQDGSSADGSIDTAGDTAGGTGSGGGAPGRKTDDKRGRKGGDASGQEGGKTVEEGGVPDAYASRLTGQDFGDPEGGRGGEGSPGDAGARGAFALFGGILGVPRAWRAAVEVAIIGGQALSPDTAFKSAVTKLGARKLGVMSLRTELRREARTFAKDEVKRLRKRFKKDLDAMLDKDRKNLLRATHDQKMRQYFDNVEQGARKRRMELEIESRANSNDAEIAAKLSRARKFEDAAAVKPVAGQFPLNHQYAGKTYPIENIDPKHVEAIQTIKRNGRSGVAFTRDGFPDFTPWTLKEGDVLADVRIEYTGTRPRDVRKADAAMRRKLDNPEWKRPIGYTWHHHEDVGRMILIPQELNYAVGHTGGVPIYRMLTGNYDAYKQM